MGGILSMERDSHENTLTVAEIIRILQRWVWVTGLVVVLFLGAGVGYSVMQTPMYEASGLVLIRVVQVDDSSGGAQGIQFEVEGLKAVTPTMARAAVSRPVVDAAIKQLNLPAIPQDFEKRFKAEPLADTQFISISYEDPSPREAQRIVNAVGDALSDQASDLRPIATPITATVWERAVVPNEPVGPNIPINVGLALVTGLVFGVLSAFMLEGLSRAGVLRKRHGKQ